MKTNPSQQIKYLTVSAMLSALGVVLLGLGSLIEVIDLSVAVIASLLVVYAVIEMGGMYPWLIWIVTSAIALLLLPLKTPVLFYALLAGYYPIVKQKIERKLPRTAAWIAKLGVLVLAIGVIWAIMRLFLPSLLEGMSGWITITVTLVLALLCFVLYDVCLNRLIAFYFARLQKRFHIK